MARAVAGLLQRLMLILIDPELHRNAALAANDGIIATAGTLEGFAGAGADEATLATSALLCPFVRIRSLALSGDRWRGTTGHGAVTCAIHQADTKWGEGASYKESANPLYAYK